MTTDWQRWQALALEGSSPCPTCAAPDIACDCETEEEDEDPTAGFLYESFWDRTK